jgi:hypothetical protein
MPFKSDSQRRFMYAQHPEIAKRWSDKTANEASLPEKVKARKDALKKQAGGK